MSLHKKIPYKRLAFALSILLLVAWGVLGTGASLAWFNDDSSEVVNVFNVADFALTVEHRLEDGSYVTIDEKTDIFNDEALYEPGYTQVVVLRIRNDGDLPFHYQTAVYVNSYVPGVNVFGQTFLLQDYLELAMVTADPANSEPALDALIATRELAAAIPAEKLDESYSDLAYLAPGDEAYMALVLRMPEEVDNIANYRNSPVPEVKLGISVSATQITN